MAFGLACDRIALVAAKLLGSIGLAASGAIALSTMDENFQHLGPTEANWGQTTIMIHHSTPFSDSIWNEIALHLVFTI